ncbi:MAG: hypothetical protein ABI778_04225 [Ignavibacteriota bacterium]
MNKIITVLAIVISAATIARAQQPTMQYYRPNDKLGLNMFEPSKNDTTQFTGLHVRIGGSFAQDYQSLTDRNDAAFRPTSKTDSTNANLLIPIAGGFNLAMANLTLDGQLEDGIRTNLTVYLSSRHHSETWVKNGYLQFDKLLFLHSDFINSVMESLTIRVGDLEVDYGDQHFRRADGGNEIDNPFVENYIMDEFATEIGTEIYFHPRESGIIAMIGITDGMLNPTVVVSSQIDSSTKSSNSYNPAFHAKLGFDKQLSEDLRVRITGSIYKESSTSSSTLFGGDRTGSHYFLVLENTAATTASTAFSGRFNPSFSDAVTTFMINPFVKFGGLEFFGTYESATGRTIRESSTRGVTQLAADLIYRFGANENFWIGARYNTVSATLPGNIADITINRIVASAGWFLTQNIMMKGEYVSQEYKNYPTEDIHSGGKFSGFIVEAALGF